MTRTEKAFKNLRFEFILQAGNIFLSFFTRKVFIQMLTQEYLGLNGVFSSILSMLSLAELGIGSAILCNMYKPLAENDSEQVSALMELYRRAYWVIGLVIGVLGTALTPFLPFLIRDLPDIPHIDLIYLMFVWNTALSYFFTYKQMLLIADQRQYIQSSCKMVFFALVQLLQILFLWLTQNYFIFLGLDMGLSLIKNLILSGIVGRLYPYIGRGQKKPLNPVTKKAIIRNIKAMITHKIGGMVVFGTDNLLIAYFAGVVNVGLYSNYQMVTKSLSRLYSRAFTTLVSSIGNLKETEKGEMVLPVFYRLNFVGCWLYGFSAVCLIALFNPFIELWLGTDFLFSQWTICLIAVNFYLTGMRQATLAFREAYGLYWYDRYRPLAEAAVNLAASVALAIPLGITGILLGTLISTVTTCFWCEPLVVFRYGLNAPVWPYFRWYAVNTGITALTAAVIWKICAVLPGTGLPRFIAQMAVCAVGGNLGFLLFYHRREEFCYFLQLAASWLSRWKRGK